MRIIKEGIKIVEYQGTCKTCKCHFAANPDEVLTCVVHQDRDGVVSRSSALCPTCKTDTELKPMTQKEIELIDSGLQLS